MAIRLTERADQDLDNIAEFYLENTDKATATRITKIILQDIRKLSIMPFLGRKDLDVAPEFQEQYEFWLIYRNQYRVYFKRLGPKTIRVLRIWPARKPPLEPGDILN